MESDHNMIDKVHRIDKMQGEHGVKIHNLETWLNDIHKTLKAVELKVTLAAGAFVAIELFFKFWK